MYYNYNLYNIFLFRYYMDHLSNEWVKTGIISNDEWLIHKTNLQYMNYNLNYYGFENQLPKYTCIQYYNDGSD